MSLAAQAEQGLVNRSTGNVMKRSPSIFSIRPMTRTNRGFTLVEMLVVITIIGILAGLTTAAAIAARNRARIAAISMELQQLDMALKVYRDKFGEYPPDGTDASAVYRHILRAFPRCTSIPNYIYDPSAGTTTALTPSNALVFWLGGVANSDGQLIGFSANPQTPFDTTTTSRIGPFFDFDIARLTTGTVGTTTNAIFQNTYRYWPSGAAGDKTTGAIVYFRAENGIYRVNGLVGGTVKTAYDVDPVTSGTTTVYPAGDTRLGFKYNSAASGTNTNAWVNPRSFQILSSGMDCTFGTLTGSGINGLAFPTGEDYGDGTFDDITNFSSGRLEDAIP